MSFIAVPEFTNINISTTILHIVYNLCVLHSTLSLFSFQFLRTCLVAEHTCFEIPVPFLKHTEPSYVDVQVQVQVNETVESGQNQDPVLVYPNRNTVLIQTDREMYKPGDRIRIRLLVLNQDLFGDSKYKVTQKIEKPAIFNYTY